MFSLIIDAFLGLYLIIIGVLQITRGTLIDTKADKYTEESIPKAARISGVLQIVAALAFCFNALIEATRPESQLNISSSLPFIASLPESAKYISWGVLCVCLVAIIIVYRVVLKKKDK